MVKIFGSGELSYMLSNFRVKLPTSGVKTIQIVTNNQNNHKLTQDLTTSKRSSIVDGTLIKLRKDISHLTLIIII